MWNLEWKRSHKNKRRIIGDMEENNGEREES
jgi:hypothetical protein